MLIPLFVENIQFKALLDTGSTISAINSQTLKRIQKHTDKLQNSAISFITGAGGTAHNVNGKIDLKIKIANLNLVQTFYVIQDLCQPIILGTYFMEKQKACIDWGTKSLYLQECSTHVNLMNIGQGVARVVKTVNIPPNCFANIPVKILRTEINETILLEPVMITRNNWRWPSVFLSIAQNV